MKELLNQFARHYNPAVRGEENINKEKILHLVKRWMYDNQSDVTNDVEGVSGKTLYNTLKAMPMGTLLIAIYEDDYTVLSWLVIENQGSVSKYPYLEEFPDRYQAAEKALAEVHAQGLVGSSAKVETTVTDTSDTPLVVPSASERKVLDVVLENSKLPSIEELINKVNTSSDLVLEAQLKSATSDDKLKDTLASMKAKEKEFKKQLSSMDAELKAKPFKDVAVESDGTVPEGKVVMKSLSKLFPSLKITKEEDQKVPCWEWTNPDDGSVAVHPDVPNIDSKYIFRKKELLRVIYSIVTNQRCYLQGDTGTGKTTLIEQVAAHLNWPFARVNFDSEITRMDLIGRDTLTTDDEGNTVSEFIDGILPRMMSGPYLGCFDELDFVRPDVSYVMQGAFEGNGLRITEDGDRVVKPHEMFRMFATGNTVGQGDEKGMYQGARPQSLALLDRFTVWAKIDYLEPEQREALLKDTCPTLTEKDVQQVGKYTTEHLEAFKEAKVIQPISPRGMLAVGKAVAYFNSVNSQSPVKDALEMTVLDRANLQDYAVLRGLVDRVAK